MSQHHPVGWFEVPVLDMDRAIKFYETVLSVKLEKHDLGPLQMAWFPMLGDVIGSNGALVKHETYKPSTEGVLIYFTSPTGHIDKDLEAVKQAGGKVLIPRKEVGETFGFMAVILDSEGNRVALHSLT